MLIRGEVDISNVYLPNFLERRLDGAPIIGLCTEWKSTGKGNGLFVLNGMTFASPADLGGRRVTTHQGRHAIHAYLLEEDLWRRFLDPEMGRKRAGDSARVSCGAARPTRWCCSISSSITVSRPTT